MPRKPRWLQLAADAAYHVLSRGHNREAIFAHDQHKQQFLALLARYRDRFGFRLYHYCVLSNHFHLLLQLEDPRRLSALMAGLLMAYVRWYQRQHGFVGHLFQGRFKSPLVQRAGYWLSCGRYIERKAATVIESARQLSRFCDIYKAEFPGHLGRDTDAQLKDNLRKLNEASERPWVLLSAGVDFPEYKKQVEMAVSAGASGVLGGRAFWKEYFQHDGPQVREQFARHDAADRVRQIADMVEHGAKPWYARYGLTLDELHAMRACENWHFRYGERGTRSGGTTAITEGDVY